MLVDSINKMHETTLFIEKKHAKTQKNIFEKQFDYFKCKYKIINKAQMNRVKAITSLTHVMSTMLMKNEGGGKFNNTNLVGHDLPINNDYVHHDN